jgi:3-phenylpropionate/cinnamic acid dioxygenase small subunit
MHSENGVCRDRAWKRPKNHWWLPICVIAFVSGVWLTPKMLIRETPSVQAADSLDADRQAILDVISRYSYAWDGKDADAFAALFDDDAVMSAYNAGTLGSTVRTSKQLHAGARARHDWFTAHGIQTRHYQTNTILERMPDGSVRGTTMFSVLWQYATDPAPKPVHTGVYRDVFVKTRSGWKFASREVRIDHK